MGWQDILSLKHLRDCCNTHSIGVHDLNPVRAGQGEQRRGLAVARRNWPLTIEIPVLNSRTEWKHASV